MSAFLCKKLYHLSGHCKSMSHMKQLLSQIIQTGASNHASSLTSLLSFAVASPNGDLHLASQAFWQIHGPSSFAYNSMIQGLVNARLPDRALLLYLRMNREGSPPPDNFTFPFAIKACTLLLAVGAGRALHARVLLVGLSRDSHIQSGLIRMYSEFDDIDSARYLFDGIGDKDAILWNSMIGGYVKCRRLEGARQLFDEMPDKNIGTYNALIGGYVKMGCLDKACRLFEEMPKRDVVSWNTVIGAHARSGSVVTARELFNQAPQKNLATWSTIISGFAQSSQFVDALDVFGKMLSEGRIPNQAILLSVLSSCAHLGALEQGIWIHGYIGRQGFKVDDLLGSSLIDMYSKCGMLEGAVQLFNELEKKDACSWTSMIYALAIHGHSQQALDTFAEMERVGIIPTDITFVAILSACSHAGLVQNGRKIFHRMHRVYDMIPKIEHYTCMVDLLSRANLIEEAREVIESMPMELDIFVWGALLGGLRIHGRKELVHREDVGREVTRLEPRDSGAYVLVSNIYASIDQWDDAVKMRSMMMELGVRKNPGCSLIEVDGVVHEFLASGTQNTRSLEVYEMLDCIYRRIQMDHWT